LSNSLLKVFAGPEVSAAAFRQQCAEAARASRDEEVQKTSATYDKKIDTLQVKLEAEERELDQDESELSNRKMDELGTHAETVMKFFSKRRKSLSSSMNKRRMTDKAKADVKESKDAIASLKQQIAELEKEKTAALEAIQDRWGEAAAAQEEIAVRPTKTNVYVELFGVAWVPYHLIQSGAEQFELSGYGE
jgi:chromosome segregation ATPase